ncbi:MAG TPA: ankyrin repeat domain-containing protein [Bryobacteraceae bacterium]|jgi:ankyrin repeat protein|nr:ankyrin repeat domain-containing protein [Bryobacteraceae bacterium]
MKNLICSLYLAAAMYAAGGDTQLPDAAMQGDRESVHALLKKHADVNAAQGDGMTALHWAAAKDDLEMARLLIAAGANVKAANRVAAVTPLSLAATNGNAAMIAILLQAGADPNAATTDGATPLMAAAASGSAESVATLLDHGAQINATESARGQTALMFAAAKNRAAAIQVLLQHKADPAVTTKVVKLEKPKFDEDGNPIVERKVKPGTQLDPATAAAMARRVTASVIGGMTALLLASRNGHMDAVRALVEGGANVNQVSAGDKSSPIVIAICNGHYDLAKYLLDHGADPNIATMDGLAALYAVIDTQWAPFGWSANPITNQERITYLELMKALLDRGADPNARLTRLLWFRPTSHNQMWIGSAGSTPFWRAAQATDLPAMHLLIEKGADPKIASTEGVTPLMVAAGLGWNGNYSKNAPTSALDAVRYCLELGLDPTPKDVQGFTALAGAAYRGDNELVKLLVEKGAKMDVRTVRGWSVTDMANGPSLRSSVPMKHPETVALLVQLGAPPLTAVEGEEILGIIRRRPATAANKPGADTPPPDKPAPAAIPAQAAPGSIQP